jgi:ribosomal protein S4
VATAVGRGRPTWISAGGDELTVTVSALPTRQDIDATINEQLIVELTASNFEAQSSKFKVQS